MDTLYDIFEDKTDTNASENGVWVDINAKNKIRVRAILSPKSMEVRKELDKPYALRKETGSALTEDETQEITTRHIAEGLISDWSGPVFRDEDGKELKYTPENAYKILSDPKLVKFSAFILKASMSEELYTKKYEETAEKN